MKTRMRVGAGLIALACASSLWADDGVRPAKSEKFSIGHVWRYKTREGETDSRVHIGRIESIRDQVVIHVKLTGLSIRAGGQTGSVIAHTPIAEDSLAGSVVELTQEPADLGHFDEGYAGWREAFDAGGAGWFTISLAEIVATIETSLN